MVSRLFLLTSAVLLAGCAHPTLRVDPRWTGGGLPEHQIGARVRIRSELPAATLRDVADEFTRAADDVARVLGLSVPPHPALLVVRRASGGDVPELRAIGGVVMPHDGTRVVLTVRDQLTPHTREVIRHEAVHWLLVRTLWIERPDGTRSPGIPRWLDEGLATAFEAGPTGTEDNQARRDQFRRLASPRWRGVLGMKHTLALLRGQRMASADYARAWAMCSFLLREHPEQLAELVRCRTVWCGRSQPQLSLREHEERLNEVSRREFDAVVLHGRNLAAWFEQVCLGVKPGTSQPSP